MCWALEATACKDLTFSLLLLFSQQPVEILEVVPLAQDYLLNYRGLRTVVAQSSLLFLFPLGFSQSKGLLYYWVYPELALSDIFISSFSIGLVFQKYIHHNVHTMTKMPNNTFLRICPRS